MDHLRKLDPHGHRLVFETPAAPAGVSSFFCVGEPHVFMAMFDLMHINFMEKIWDIFSEDLKSQNE